MKYLLDDQDYARVICRGDMMDGLVDSGPLIKGQQLRRAREALAMSPDEVAEELSAASGDIRDWEAGKTEPSLEALERLSKLYGRAIDYFLRDVPESPAKVAFRVAPERARKGLPREARIVLAKFDELCRIAAEFEQLAEKRREVKLRPFEKETSPAEAALQTRREFELADKPIPNLRQLLESLGVWIFELKVPDNSFSGLSNWHQEYGPCVLVNAGDPAGRRQFTLAHECAHLLYKEGPCVCEIQLERAPGSIPEERVANQFAVELLMPETGVTKDFRKRGISSVPTERELGNMAGKWKASMQALGYRLEDLQLVEQEYTDGLVAKWKTKPIRFRRPKTPTWERRLGERFVSAAITAYKKRRISIGKLAHSFGIPIRKAHEKYA